MSGDGFISKWLKAESGTGVGIVLVEAVPPADVCPEGWLLADEEDAELLELVKESALVGVPVERLEPVGDPLLDALLTVLFCAVSDDDELVPALEDSGVP